MTDLNEMYRAEGWGNVTDKALGIPPEDVESQARMVASWAHTELSQLKALNAELVRALINAEDGDALQVLANYRAIRRAAVSKAESGAQS